ncbi:MAG: ferritin family protein [Planctomycetaceae bacterium]|nr:ferritin family protein [Planctomycetaceae bacterium]
MDIFEFAIQMEMEGQRYYEELAAKSPNPGIKHIMTMLAEDETKHRQTIEKIRLSTCVMTETKILENTRNVFEQLREQAVVPQLTGDEESLYRHAMEIENESIAFYLDRADQVDTPEQKSLFERLAEEERKHHRLLAGLLEFVSRPKTWLEDAEYNSFGNY